MSLIFRRLCTKKSIQILVNNASKKLLHQTSQAPTAISAIYNPNLQILRYKSKVGKNKASQKVSESEAEEDQDDDIFDDINSKHTKTLNIHVPSMRVDTLLKAGLGLSRNKIEVLFYGSNIRVNGEKIVKKSVGVQEGDEIDVIKGPSPTNPDFLIVARVEILSAKGEDDSINVKIRRCKTLTIDNYEGRNKWSHSSQSEQ